MILKDFCHETLINSNNVFEQNQWFFNHDEFKNNLKDIPWIVFYLWISRQVWLSIWFFARVNTLLDEHAPNHKLSKKQVSLKAKP